ncbi:unnamed protein product [Cylindrotheca closterium]|uniref:Solute-binding protein family 3/N-terminal domain-containing protein n=1 Tax=Cylindrotheca closterium TaxID=2856 RepID=A0AAD2CWR0_9STRA|nr:unnamed protein product [Cylindrotheca closterium]
MFPLRPQPPQRGVSTSGETDAPPIPATNIFDPNRPVRHVNPRTIPNTPSDVVSVITVDTALASTADDRTPHPEVGTLRRPMKIKRPMATLSEVTGDIHFIPDGGADSTSTSPARDLNFNPQDDQGTINTGFSIGDGLGGVQGGPSKKPFVDQNPEKKHPLSGSVTSRPGRDREYSSTDQGTDDQATLVTGFDEVDKKKKPNNRNKHSTQDYDWNEDITEVNTDDATSRKKKKSLMCVITCLVIAGAGAGYYFSQRSPQDIDSSTTAPSPEILAPALPVLTESNMFPLLLCQGDCDVDMDCQDGLYCFQRNSFEPVPGCDGEDSSNTDYCIPRPEGPSIVRYGERLVGAPRSRLGSSVSQSKNGQILAVAGSNNDSNTGYVNIYISQPGETWDLMATLVGNTDGGRFGSNIALSADGSTLVVGSQLDLGLPSTGTRAASAQVFSASSDFRSWTLIGNEIIGDEYAFDEFSSSIDISSKGDYVALGQPNSNSLQGGAAVYRNDNDEWTYVGSPFSQFQTGSSVKLSETATGNLRVAANGDDNHFGPGQVYVVELDTSTGVWRTIGQSLGENVGSSIALCDDGSVMALSITNRRSNANDGDGPRINGPEYVLVYQYSEAASRWVQFGNLIPIASSDITHLPSISLSHNGLVLAVGEPWYNDNDGRVNLYRYNSRTERWELLDDELVEPVDGGFFGASLSLVGSSDDFMLTVGAPVATVDDTTQGSIWSYQLEPTQEDPQNDTTQNPGNPIMAPTTAPITSITKDDGSTLEAVVRRGLKCGIMLLPGRATISPQTDELEGLSIDLCLALAAAAGVAPDDVTFVQLSTVDRFEALQTRRVDVLLTSDTVTMQRAVFEPSAQAGLVFSVPYLYSGSGFAGRGEQTLCVDRRDFESANCTGINICVVEGTTHQDDLEAMVANKGVNVVLASSLAVLHSRFRDNFCDVIAGDSFDISEPVARQFGYSGDYMVGSNLTLREPLGMVTRQDDPRWSDFVNWALQATFRAEELGVLQVNAFTMPTTDVFGPSYATMFKRIIAAVGNYGEMYARSVEGILPRFAINQINDGSTGLISPLPLGRYEISGPSPSSESKLEVIKARGYLNCGISRRPIFAYVNNGKYEGFDVDFCRAIAAAIFSGRASASVLRFVDLGAQERFSALVDGTVDVLSRLTTVNLQRDVLEATTEIGFDFTAPNYYDGLSFGGVPSFVDCADNLNFRSSDCQDLKICVVAGTTFEEKLREFGVDDGFLVLQSAGYLLAEGLRMGTCNVVAGGVSDLSRSNIQAGGYTGDYQVGGKILSKDPLALVTLSDDRQWSNFCFWVVQAIFYADEQGINSNDAGFRMPVTNLFGPSYSRMLRDAVVVAGSYADMYNSHFLSELGSRRGLNLANSSPHTPLIYPLPGIG